MQPRPSESGLSIAHDHSFARILIVPRRFERASRLRSPVVVGQPLACLVAPISAAAWARRATHESFSRRSGRQQSSPITAALSFYFFATTGMRTGAGIAPATPVAEAATGVPMLTPGTTVAATAGMFAVVAADPANFSGISLTTKAL